MLAIVAAVLFVITFVIRVTETSTEVIFSPTSLLVGLAFLAVHSAGVGSGWSSGEGDVGAEQGDAFHPLPGGSERGATDCPSAD
jgi:hypothetical protein